MVENYILNGIDRERQRDEHSKAFQMLLHWKKNWISSDPTLLSLITTIESTACPEDQSIVQHVCGHIMALSTERSVHDLY